MLANYCVLAPYVVAGIFGAKNAKPNNGTQEQLPIAAPKIHSVSAISAQPQKAQASCRDVDLS